MTAKRMKVTEDMLGPFDIRAPRNLEDAERSWKEIFRDNPPAVRLDIPPCGWSRVKYYTDKILLRGESL